MHRYQYLLPITYQLHIYVPSMCSSFFNIKRMLRFAYIKYRTWPNIIYDEMTSDRSASNPLTR